MGGCLDSTAIYHVLSEAFAFVLVLLTTNYCDGYVANSGSLTEIPDDIPDDAQLISLSMNAITQIKSRVFLKKSVCKELIVQNNGIFNIEPEAFVGLNALEELDLGWNRIQFSSF